MSFTLTKLVTLARITFSLYILHNLKELSAVSNPLRDFEKLLNLLHKETSHNQQNKAEIWKPFISYFNIRLYIFSKNCVNVSCATFSCHFKTTNKQNHTKEGKIENLNTHFALNKFSFIKAHVHKSPGENPKKIALSFRQCAKQKLSL